MGAMPAPAVVIGSATTQTETVPACATLGPNTANAKKQDSKPARRVADLNVITDRSLSILPISFYTSEQRRTILFPDCITGDDVLVQKTYGPPCSRSIV